jgi:hypothetical protein
VAASIANLTYINLLAVRDVVADLQDAFQMSGNPVTIPALPDIVRFRELMPTDGINFRDRYMDLRARALTFLEKEGIVSKLEALQAMHRWQEKVRCNVNGEALNAVFIDLKAEHQRRIDDMKAKSVAASPVPDALVALRNLLLQFHAVAVDLRSRRTGRPALVIEDEYDVQYLLGAFLKLHFDDVRREEWTPSYAGAASRTDFLLKKEQIVVETKMTRAGLKDGAVGNELLLDIAHYSKHPDCKTLICFIYDPAHHLTNPSGLERDLSEKKDNLVVEVVIVPSR